MSLAEHVTSEAVKAFRMEFEEGLRKRLMQEAQEQVEHIVHEVRGKLFHHASISSHYDHRDLVNIYTIRLKDTN